jgi:hypothetical protein
MNDQDLFYYYLLKCQEGGYNSLTPEQSVQIRAFHLKRFQELEKKHSKELQ